ncbi:hypothetical protein KP509_31G038500 [Ceratopteris richardii]|uniref:Uncharacterized protein n=1 Tax=Ceratopteris richardii TaxID=49495 RepID=A0A8T2QZA1_CERRI|nr:hypothetical protein KP509_31G038500 [Ceratopteris richardii]
MRSPRNSPVVLGLPGPKLAAVAIAAGLTIYIVGPSVLSHVANGFAKDAGSIRYCPSCNCDCAADGDISLLPDCNKLDPLLKEDQNKSAVGLLSEEIKLQEKVSRDSQQHAEAALLEAKKLASQYQKEAEKCNSGMETCEVAREKSELALIAQRKISAMWEKRARELGWHGRIEHHDIFSRIGLA